MSDIRQIKKRMKTVSSAKKITDSVYLLSSARLTSLKPLEKISDTRKNAIAEILAGLPESAYSELPLAEVKGGKDAVFVLASDRGLAGDFNKSLCQQAISLSAENTVFYVYGKRAQEYFTSVGIEYIAVETDSMENIADTADRLCEMFRSAFLNGEICSLTAVYGERNRGTTQDKVEKILPMSFNRGQVSDSEFIPSAEELAETVSENYYNALIFSMLITGFIAEHTARMEAMDNASDGAGKLIDELGVTYNRLRQNEITTEIASLAGERIKK